MRGWRRARLTGRTKQTATGRTLVFEVPRWPGHRPGQHVDVRLTAADGYQAVRSYSLAAPADGERVELGVQAAPGGEVSPYLADDLPVGAEVEVTGPLGGWFVWTPQEAGPLLLLAGGSGIVPLMAMVRARLASPSDEPCTLLHSVRSPDDVWYAAELDAAAAARHVRVRHLWTRAAPEGAARPVGRLTGADLRDLPPPADCRCFVCGPTGFVEHAGDLLLAAGYAPGRIRTERFG
ncbi:FAD-binding oxidoreductase [Streptomyces genisteinicus]|uniref:Oxidoreductase n=1 Tax=Streptomyces genisteinicus TaxID=2768068 RepID=A0A7H0I094_9ACTN|nr:FAD-binding oxidoreductase [Streptomyces genisteinicus]QNP66210.1 oxidoreductase [Streptomyces genisteinicus]